jgi:hypothetical protein
MALLPLFGRSQTSLYCFRTWWRCAANSSSWLVFRSVRGLLIVSCLAATRGKVALGEGKDHRVVRAWRARRDLRSAAKVSQTLDRTEWKSLFEKVAPNARRICFAGKKLT